MPRITRDSPPELARALPGPQASRRVTRAPRRRSASAVQPPKAPAPTTATWRRCAGMTRRTIAPPGPDRQRGSPAPARLVLGHNRRSMLPPTAKDPGVRAPRRGETYRLIGYCVVVGVFGAVAAIAFDAAVELAQRLLLGGIGRYVPPAAGVLGAAVPHPPWASRLWIPVSTTLGGLLSGFLVYTLAPEAEGHGTDAAVAAYH